MDLGVQRTDVTPARAFGRFAVGGVPLYVSLEPGANDNQPGVSDVPVGAYPYDLDFSEDHGYALLHILNVPGRVGILVHSLNWVINPENQKRQTLGCIGVGEEREVLEGADAIGESVVALDDLMTRLGCAEYRTLTSPEAVAAWKTAHGWQGGTITISDPTS